MSVLQISYSVQNIHCMLEAQAPTEVEKSQVWGVSLLQPPNVVLKVDIQNWQ